MTTTKSTKSTSTSHTRQPATPPLLFIHGYRGSHEGLSEIVSLLKGNYDVYTPDVPPAGGGSFTDYDTATYTQFIADYIKKHKLKKPILIGHSLGSIIAAATAARYPDLVNDKLILLSPISKKPAKLFAMLTPLPAILPVKIVDYITTKYMFISGDKAKFKKALKITHTCSTSNKNKRDLWRAGKYSASTSIADHDFHKDTYIIAGEKDRLIPIAATKALAEKIGAHLTIIPGTGHIMNYEVPEKVAKAIQKSLKM